MAVLDASVQIALVNRADPHREAALRWYRSAIAKAEPLHAPWIIVAELGSGIRRGLGDRDLAQQAVQSLIADGMVQLVLVDADLAARAAAIAIDHGIRGCDAVYVALAQALGEPLVTFDRQQSTRGAGAATVLQP